MFKMLCTIFLHALLLASLASAVAVAPVKRQVGGIGIVFSAGCNSTSRQDITDALTNAIDMAFGIKGIDTKTDIGAFEFFGPMMSTAGTDEKVHNLYKRLGSFSPVSGMNTNLKAINAFCPSDDERQRRSCTPGAIAFEWDTSCQEQESDQSCTTNATNRINPDSDKSYVNIQFCEEFFKLPTLEKVVQQGKSALKENKYNLNTYWDNKGTHFLRQLLQAASVTESVNYGLDITDIKLKIHYDDKPDESKEAAAYGALNAKILARVVTDDGFKYIQRNIDNWAGYVLAKYVQANVGVYPILPLADIDSWSTNSNKPEALFLQLSNPSKKVVNQDTYNNNTLVASNTLISNLLSEKVSGGNDTVADWTVRGPEDYPNWYNDALKNARGGDYDSTAAAAAKPKPVEPPAPPKVGKTLQVFAKEYATRKAIFSLGPTIQSQEYSEFEWSFFPGEAGQGTNPCGRRDGQLQKAMGIVNVTTNGIINGEWAVTVPDLTGCIFQGIGKIGESGDNGWLKCSSRPAIMCIPDNRPQDECNGRGYDHWIFKAVSHCDW